ncbi:uncharacterized protein L203_100745 [Cryptococcus depauperatus CBS 7841]|uniref:Uncharacterized protein n=1 Tax=Cryptococcus depauperatus CBS 7841 TaxID=1295531 RepID=A0AAJ8JNR5_9TREE
MSLYSNGQERFTITDYVYDRGQIPHRDASTSALGSRAEPTDIIHPTSHQTPSDGLRAQPLVPTLAHPTMDHCERGDAQSIFSDVSAKRGSEFISEKDYGLDFGPPPPPKLRWYDRFVPSTLLTRLLLATVVVELVIDLTIEGNILYRFNGEVKSTHSTELELENRRRLPIYLIIFGLAHWQRYRFLGADLMIRSYFFKFQVFECICYFSAFFCAGFGIQFIWLVLNPDDVEYIITWIAFPLLIVFLVIGRFAAQYENITCMATFMVGLCAGIAYFVFKLVRIWQQSATTYVHLEKSLTTFAALSIASLLACELWGLMVWINFGKGLKHAMMAKNGSGMWAGLKGFWLNGGQVSEEKPQEISMSQRRIIE